MLTRVSVIKDRLIFLATNTSTLNILGTLVTGNSPYSATKNALLGTVGTVAALTVGTVIEPPNPANLQPVNFFQEMRGALNNNVANNIGMFLVLSTVANLSGSLLQYFVGSESPSLMEQAANEVAGSLLLAGGLRTARFVRDWMAPSQTPQAETSSSQNTLRARA